MCLCANQAEILSEDWVCAPTTQIDGVTILTTWTEILRVAWVSVLTTQRHLAPEGYNLSANLWDVLLVWRLRTRTNQRECRLGLEDGLKRQQSSAYSSGNTCLIWLCWDVRTQKEKCVTNLTSKFHYKSLSINELIIVLFVLRWQCEADGTNKSNY